MTKVAATLPGYASVARASEVLHLSPSSVRRLIYAGRLPSLRVGRLHYIKTMDLDLERRRRLGLPLPRPTSTKPRARRRSSAVVSTQHLPIDPEVRRQRAAERAAQRAELVKHWAQRHEAFAPHVPAAVHVVDNESITCEVCSRQIRRGRYVELTPEPGQRETQLCVTCARRALLEWADRRRLEAAAARRLSLSLGQPDPQPALQLDLLVA